MSGTPKTPEEILADLGKAQADFAKAISEKADNSVIMEIKSQIDSLKDAKQTAEFEAFKKEQTTIVLAQGEEITKLKETSLKSNKEIAKTFGKAIALEVREKFDDIVKTVKERKGQFAIEIELKDAGTMTRANYTGGIVGLSDMEAGFTRIQRRSPFLRQIVNVGTTNKQYVTWVEQANPDPGVAGMTAEGETKTQTDFDVVERNTEVKKVTCWIKVSMEMLEDVDFIQGEIEGELVELIELKLDEQILSGDGLTVNMKGILEYAPAFDALTLGGTIVDANNFDVLRAAVAQIAVANFMPNYALINPIDAAAMDLAKASDGHYVMPPFSTADGKRVAGLIIIENNGIEAGTFVVGDFTKSNLRVRKALSVTIGRDGNDFTKNLFTILAEMRAAHYIKTNHINAFVQGTFSTAIAALLASPVEAV